MAWIRLSGVSVLSGASIVDVDHGSTSGINVSDAIMIDGHQMIEVSGVFANQLTLSEEWPHDDKLNVPAAIVATYGDFNKATQAMRDTADIAQSNLGSLNTWGSQLGEVEFRGFDGTLHYARTMKQMDIDIENVESDIRDVVAQIMPSYNPKNRTFIDAQGNLNEMVLIPAFNCEDINARILQIHGFDLNLGTGLHPAFVKGGQAINKLWIGKYQASAGAGGGCSVVGNAQPRTSVTFDAAQSICESKGTNWHLMSAWEWSALALWSLANDTIPRGNTYHGLSHEARHETAKRGDTRQPGDASGTGRSDCGTGPATWSHDRSVAGVYDLVGNVWEWLDGFYLQDGQFIVNPDNDFELEDSQWSPQQAFLDAVSDITLSNEITNRDGAIGDDSNAGASRSKMLADVTKSAAYQENELMRRLFVELASKPMQVGRLYMRNYGSRRPLRGGSWNSSSNAGLGALSLSDSRSISASLIGFRPAYFEL